MSRNPELIKTGLKCRCPRCRDGRIFKPGLSWDLKDKCDLCGLALSESDSADGPAFILIFVLGFLLVPLALWLEFAAAPPLWLHAVLWGGLALAITLAALRPLKACIIALEYKHRTEDRK